MGCTCRLLHHLHHQWNHQLWVTHVAVTMLDLAKCNMQVSGSGLDMWPWCSTSSFFEKSRAYLWNFGAFSFFLVMFLFLQNEIPDWGPSMCKEVCCRAQICMGW